MRTFVRLVRHLFKLDKVHELRVCQVLLFLMEMPALIGAGFYVSSYLDGRSLLALGLFILLTLGYVNSWISKRVYQEKKKKPKEDGLRNADLNLFFNFIENELHLEFGPEVRIAGYGTGPDKEDIIFL